MKALILGLLIVLVLSGAIVVVAGWFIMRDRHPDEYVRLHVIDPLPATLHHVKTLYLFDPTMGDGSCILAYSVTRPDFVRLFEARPWTKGLPNHSFNPAPYFSEAWPSSSTEFDAYHFGVPPAKSIEMAVSRDRTRIIFNIQF